MKLSDQVVVAAIAWVVVLGFACNGADSGSSPDASGPSLGSDAGPPAGDAKSAGDASADTNKIFDCSQLKDGASCAGGQACPKGHQCITEDTKLVCRITCNPTGKNQCGGVKCGRTCNQVVDSKQQPIPGLGVCVPDRGAGPGEPCSSTIKTTACKQTLRCIGGKVFFCRQTCTAAADCKGYKMICGTIGGLTEKYCTTGRATNGVKVGEDCSAVDKFCLPDHFCDPKSKKCLKACTISTDGKTDTCTPATSKEKCTKVVDDAAKVTIGYGCIKS